MNNIYDFATIFSGAGALLQRVTRVKVLALLMLCALGMALPLHAAEPDYFTVTNTHTSQKITVQFKRGSNPPTNVTLNYRIVDAGGNAGAWQTLTTVNTTINYTLGDIPAGSRMQIYGNNPSGFAQGTMNYWKFYFGTTGSAVLSGELMSIFSGTETSIDINKTLPNYAFYGLFYENSAKNPCITSSKNLKLSATNRGQNCYKNMFMYCANMKDAPALPATTLQPNCYDAMFSYCSSLTEAPELPAMTLANNCYQSMFSYCTSLTTAPLLNATTLTEGCYNAMFKGCTALVNVQSELPGTNLPKNCYYEMFSGCTALRTAPEIMAGEDATVGQGACYNMFTDCTNLIQAPSVLRPRTINVNQVYYNMFLNCTSLQRGPDVWATTIKSSSNSLFGLYQKATSLTHIRVHFKAWGSMSFCNQWSVQLPQKGAFYCPPELERNFTNSSWNHIPYSPDYPWTVFSYNLTYIPVEGEWPKGGTTPQQYTWETDTNYVQGWMRELDAYGASYWHDAACTQPFLEEEIIAFLATQQETSSDITKNIYVKLGEVAKVKITFIDHDNKELAAVEVAKGTVPVYPYTNPAQYAVGDKIYYFTGWSPAIVAATADATYKAVYSDTERYEYVGYALRDEDSQPDFECSPVAPEPPEPDPEPETLTGTTCDHEWVQLWTGGPKWAKVNIGASSETEAGSYFMWGGTTANPSSCNWSNCPYKGSNQNTAPYTKYGVAADGNIVLESGDDAAAQTWGCGWRIPTQDEMNDLLTKCTVTYNQSKRGYTFTSKEDPTLSIFMPTAGYRFGSSVFNVGKYARYLTATSTASPTTKDRDCFILYWYTNSSYDEDHKPETKTQSVRYWGMSVRAVCDK